MTSADVSVRLARGRRARVGRAAQAAVPFTPLAVLAGLVVIGPAWDIARYALRDLGLFGEVLGDHRQLEVLRRTLVTSGVATLTTVALAYAYVAVVLRSPRWIRVALLAATAIPFFAGDLIRTYGWLILLGSNGPVNDVVRFVAGETAELDLLYARAGVVVGMVSVLLPLAVLPLYSVWSRVPPELSRAARTLGANRADVFFRVTLPLSLPGAGVGALLVFVTGCGFYVAPALLGGTDDTMVSQLIARSVSRANDLDEAAVLSIVLALGIVALLLLSRLVIPLESLVVTDRAGGKTSAVPTWLLPPPVVTKVMARLPWKTLTVVLTGVSLALLIAPMLVVVPVGFSAADFIQFPPDGYSTRWFASVASDPTWEQAVRNSLVVAVAATSIALATGVPAGVAIARGVAGRRIGGLISLAVVLPVVVPVVVMSLGVFGWFLDRGWLGSRLALGAVHATLGLPFVVLLTAAAVRELDPRLEDAARSLGAGRWTAFRRITLPLVAAAVASAAFFAFLLSFHELLIAQAVSTPETTTLPMRLFDGANEGLSPALAAVATATLVAVLALAASGKALMSLRSRIR